MAIKRRWIIVVTHPAVLKQIKNADERHLSMQAAADERNSMSYLLSNCIHENPLHVAIIQRKMRHRLLELIPDMLIRLDEILKRHITVGADWVTIETSHLVLECISITTNRVLVGEELSGDKEWLDLSEKLSLAISEAGLLVDLTPRCFKQAVAWYLLPSGIWNAYLSKLSGVFEEREKRMHDYDTGLAERPKDAIQWILEAAGPSSLYNLCMYILYIQFSSIHTSAASLMNALFDLACHRESQIPIQREIAQVLELKGGWNKQALSNLKSVDSSLRESQRLHPVTTATMMRKALQPLFLADGTFLSKGQWVVVPAWAINRSTEIHTDAHTFKALRSLESSQTDRESPVDAYVPGDGFLSFGLGRHACPGRWFAASELKLILAFILAQYDFKLPSDTINRPMNNFRFFSCVPDGTQRLVFRARGKALR
ncbi:cytochrome P450 [Penicillium frequentans]|uniref:Cytochrome P450 n=1 Tax=Penicillium frequentans TaxID=3151616 RepID=A0AAD6GFR7_9EURO|nr:cytochrome P450 [Penicillium glabrum]